jgi:hypothetical protein
MERKSELNRLLGIGAIAGLAGSAVMMALRAYDQKHVPKSVPRAREDPGEFMVRAAERATGKLPKPLEKSAAMALHTGYGTMFGVAYSLLRRRSRERSSLADGMALGSAVYAASYFGWLPALGLTRPVWKQRPLEIAGELWRHVAYGIATTTVYGLIHGAL